MVGKVAGLDIHHLQLVAVSDRRRSFAPWGYVKGRVILMGFLISKILQTSSQCIRRLSDVSQNRHCLPYLTVNQFCSLSSSNESSSTCH